MFFAEQLLCPIRKYACHRYICLSCCKLHNSTKYSFRGGKRWRCPNPQPQTLLRYWTGRDLFNYLAVTLAEERARASRGTSFRAWNGVATASVMIAPMGKDTLSGSRTRFFTGTRTY